MIFTVAHQAGLAVVSINRPPVNAIGPDFIDELEQLAGRLGADPTVRAVLFTSAIPGRFIAGADLSGILTGESELSVPERVRQAGLAWRRAFYALEQMPQITLGAIDGHCLGGGLEFALCLDYRLMIDDGKAAIGLTETNLGLFPGSGGCIRLPRLVGLGQAKDMIYRGRRLLAPEAKAIGLVDQVYGAAEFQEQALAFARSIAAGPTLALRHAKAAIMAGLTDVAQADRLEGEGFAQIVQTADAAEGLSAFWEKRPPVFQGR